MKALPPTTAALCQLSLAYSLPPPFNLHQIRVKWEVSNRVWIQHVFSPLGHEIQICSALVITPEKKACAYRTSTYTASQQLDRLSSELWISIVVYVRTANQYNVLLNAHKVHNKVYVQGIALQHDVSLFLRTPNVLTSLPSLGIFACLFPPSPNSPKYRSTLIVHLH